VRWRARFLNEVGDQTAVESLRRVAERESEFDVQVEMLAAMEREGGEQGRMPICVLLRAVGSKIYQLKGERQRAEGHILER